MEKIKIKFSLLFLFFSLSSCSSLLYYPTRDSAILSEEFPFRHEDIWFLSEDNTRLHAWYFHSDLRQIPKATIVFFHGNAENISTHFRSLVWILEYGFDFFIFDYRGYGLSEGKASPKGTLIDGIAAIRWVHQQTDKKPLVIYGQSLGGTLALRSVIDLKGQVPICLLVVDSSFHSYQGIAKKILSRNLFTWIFQPLVNLLMSDEYAPGQKIKEIAPVPLVVIHGQKDTTIEYEFGKKIFDLALEPKEIWTIPEGRHIDSFWRHQTAYRKKFIEKLNKVLSIK